MGNSRVSKKIFRYIDITSYDRCSLGTIDCEYFVNAAGYFGRLIGNLSKPPVKVPLYPCEHYFLHTQPVDGINENMPVIHDYDGNFYIR